MLATFARSAAPKASPALSRQRLNIAVLQAVPRNVRPASRFSRPRITDRTVWDSIVPRAIRERNTDPTAAQTVSPRISSSEWNPATFFIVIFLIIGSNAINLIAVRTGAQNFSSKTEARIATLKEAIERVHKGERVDVKKLLGTDDEAQEREWEEAMAEIEAAVRSRKPTLADADETMQADKSRTISDAKEISHGTTTSDTEGKTQVHKSANPAPRFY